MMVTVYDVAEKTGLSIASVSRALNGKPGVSRETVERVRAVAADLDFEPSDIARAMVLKSTQTVAILVPELTNPFFPELVHGFQVSAIEVGYIVLLSSIPNHVSGLKEVVSALRRKQVDGLVVIAGTLELQGHESIFDGVPTVFLDRHGCGGQVRSVGIDHELGAYIGVRHLIELGHRTIAHIAGPAHLAVSQDREAGWRRACTEAGLQADDVLLVRGDFSEVSGYAAGQKLTDHEKSFSSVFAANDLSAIGFMAYCADHGIRVPDDVSLVGFDGIALSRYVSPRLTTVAQPIAALGSASFAALMRAIADDRTGIAGGESVVLASELVRGATSTAFVDVVA